MNKKTVAWRAELADKIAEEWIRRGLPDVEATYSHFWPEMESYAVEVVTDAYAKGFRLSQSKGRAEWNSALTIACDALRKVDHRWVRAVMLELQKPNQGEFK